MKASDTKTTTTAHQLQTKGAAQQPFFQKESGDGILANGKSSFFSPSSENDKDQQAFFKKTTPPPFVQAKLTIGQPGDKYEQEADRTADQVVQTLSENKSQPQTLSESILLGTISRKPLSITPIQRKCAECEAKEQEEAAPDQESIQMKPIFESNAEPPPENIEEGNGPIQRKCSACEQEEQIQQKASNAVIPQASSDLESRLQSTKGGGSPLPENTRSQMEGAFGTDFSSVRVHTDNSAVQMNKELGAQAFTHGSDVYFNAGRYDTGSKGGQHLLAHELTHTVQQGGGINAKMIQKNGEEGHSASENEAIEGNTVPDGTAVEETHSTDCPQLVPPYPTEEHTGEAEGETSIYEELIGMGLSGGFLGVYAAFGLAGRALWLLLPDSLKVRIINSVLDTAITGAYLQRVIGGYLPGGFLNEIFGSILIGFYKALRNLPDEQKLSMFHRHMRIVLGGDLTFTIHYLKGIIMGFFLDGLVGIVQMVIDIICFIPRIINFFTSLTNFIRNIPNELGALAISLNSMMAEIGNFLQNGIQEIKDLISDPSRIHAFFDSIKTSINVAAESIGRSAALAFVRFMNRSSAALGEIAGRIAGQVIFEAVLIYFTAAVGAGVTAAKAAIRYIGRFLMKIGQYIFKIIRSIGRVLKFIKNALKSAMQFLTRMFRLLAQKARQVIDKILDIFIAFRRYCRPGSVICDVLLQIERKIVGTQGLAHSFDRHAAQWFGRPVGRSFIPQWQSLIERATRSKQVFRWHTGNSATVGHLARIEGKYFLVQFFADGPRVGELATAFVPNQSQLSQILSFLR
ncbi:MAG: DUF4157 domain-containing protein [Saprospiraceae bacterium]